MHIIKVEKSVKRVYFVRKWKDAKVIESLKEISNWIQEQFNHIEQFTDIETQKLIPSLKIFEEWTEEVKQTIDLVICLGGDGTVLLAASLFQKHCPPLLAFNFGSLGFLTPFTFDEYKETLTNVLNGKCFVIPRLRFNCKVLKEDPKNSEEFNVLNETSIDRGPSPYLTLIDCYCDGKHITTVQADGIILSTATGSTAYSLAAGGALVHPLLPAMLFTPICPHTLSFRPVILPIFSVVRLMLPKSARPAWASFDGRHRVELVEGEGVEVRASEYPCYTVTRTEQITDWFASLAQKLNWNKRPVQSQGGKSDPEFKSQL